MEYETVIGLEIHVQLLTRSKMFCSCRADYQAASPNITVCPVCLGLPGVLPTINKRAVEYTAMTGLALNCRIAHTTRFDRKNYPYPDLMKGYQISQYDNPIASDGYLDLELNGHKKRVGIERVHLEEDVAKLQHVVSSRERSYSLVDVNRSGVALMEVVSRPDMRSPEEARLYLNSVHSLLQYIGVSTANMQDGSFRCDTNVSIRPLGSSELGSKVEVKNLNSFRSVNDALEYEVERQTGVVNEGGRVLQETRGWSEEREVTFAQRSKEYAHDYRYFPEPDLPPMVIDPQWVEELRASLPELPQARRQRFASQYGLSQYDANQLTTSRATADFFEATVADEVLKGQAVEARAKSISNWVVTEVNRLLNRSGLDIDQCRLTPANLAQLVDLVESGSLSNTLAKMVLEEAFNSGKAPKEIVEQQGYVQISDVSVMESAVDEAVTANPQAVADYLKGKETASRFLVGQVMKITRGKGNPTVVNDLVIEKLEALKAS